MSSVPWLAGKSQWEQIHSYFKKPWMRLKTKSEESLGFGKVETSLESLDMQSFRSMNCMNLQRLGWDSPLGRGWRGWTDSPPANPVHQVFSLNLNLMLILAKKRRICPRICVFLVFPWVESTMTGESTMMGHKTIQNLASKLMYWLWNQYWYDWNLCPASATLVLQPSYLEDVGYPTNLSHHLPLEASHYNPAFIWLAKALRVYIE